MGNWLSDKYAEGTIGHRFYAGCQNIDTVEQAAADHAKALFDAPHAYVQPHSGIDANLVAFWAILAQRIESPALAEAGAKHVNDLSDEDWTKLRKALGDQKMLGMSLDAAWSPDPRIPAEHLRQDVPPELVRHQPGDRSAGLRPGRRAGPRVQAADPDRRLLRLPAQDRLRQDAGDRGRGRRHPDGRHGALRRSGRGQGLHRQLRPGPLRARHHDHHPQVASRPARRHGALPAGVRRRSRPRLPDGARWPARSGDGSEGRRPG